MYKNVLLYRYQYNSFKGIFDYKTKNSSFIKMTAILKKMGIKNRYFFLYLSQPELQGIDPFSEKLSSLQKIKIGIECKTNPWYLFREVIRIPASGSDGIRFILNRANLAALWCFFNYIDIFLTAPRQRGKTMSILSLLSVILLFIGKKIDIAGFTKDNDLRIKNVQRIRELIQLMPSYLISKSTKNKDNVNSITYDVFKNSYNSYVAQNNKIAAEKIGRGGDVPIIHIDEIVVFDNIDITYGSIVNAMPTAAKNAVNSHQPKGMIITSTSGNLDIKSGKFSYGLTQSSYRFNDTLYDIEDRDQLMKIIRKSSLAEMVYIEYSFFQLGGTQEEFLKLIEKSKREGSDTDQILRDLFNIWTSGTGRLSPLKLELIQDLKQNIRTPNFVEYLDDYTFNWYIDKDKRFGNYFKSIPIILSLDPSENIGEDFSGFNFINAKDGSILGVMRINETNIIKICDLVFNILVKYDNILFICERNSTGVTIIDILIDRMIKNNIDPIKKIFNFIIQENDNTRYTKNELLNSKIRKKFGFRTSNSKSMGRTFLFKTVLMKGLELFKDRIYDSVLIDEIVNTKKDNKGRLDHEVGKHNDVMFSYMIGLFVIFYGKYLYKYDFLDVTDSYVLQDLDLDDKDKEEDKNYDNIKYQVKKLEDRLDKVNSKLVKNKIRDKIKILKEQLPEEEFITFSNKNNVRVDNIDEEKTIVENNLIDNERLILHNFFI